MPSHALPPGRETRIRRRARRRPGDWRTFGAFLLLLVVVVSLCGGIVDHLWPKARGLEYVVTHLFVRAILSGAIGAVLVAAVAMLAVVRGRGARRR